LGSDIFWPKVIPLSGAYCKLINFLCFRVLEAEVATTISRGDTFVLLADRHDVALGQRTQSTVQQLRQQWQMLRQQAERKKSLAKTYEDKLTQFR
jgi:hypothetical protein